MKNFRLTKILTLALLITAAAIPIACGTVEEFREATAERIARPAFMIERKLNVQNMDLQLWERMHQRHAPANVYIEGDTNGDFLASQEPSRANPVGLHLASRDNAQNILYIARPCQYKEVPDEKECNPALWGSRRFSPEVIAAYNAALDEVKLRYDISEFNLVGYDGGANIAAVIASQRPDVVSLRTVAGNLNPALIYTKPEQKLDGDSLSAMAAAPQLANLPQHHFVGAGDSIAPAAVYHSFRQSMGPSECVHYTFVPDADHERGWVEKWPELLKSTTSCPDAGMKDYVPAALPPVPTVLDKP